MFSKINGIINNQVDETDLELFCTIIGISPSKGARSPVLWNKVFSAEKKKIKMIPLDVEPHRVEELFYSLQDNKQCLGGAIAVPYKEVMFGLTKNQLSPEVQNIGAINCFFRKDNLLSNKFTGTNTDGEASLDPITHLLEKTDKKNIALIGMGGSGKAIWAFLNKKFGRHHTITSFNRTKIENLNGPRVLELEKFELFLPTFDLVINATSAGSYNDLNSTPFDIGILKTAKADCVIYDIIYDPLKTKLILASEDRGLKTINGLRMNLIQAVLAYKYTNPTNLSIEQIFEKMNS